MAKHRQAAASKHRGTNVGKSDAKAPPLHFAAEPPTTAGRRHDLTGRVETASVTHGGAFRFFDLPSELRLRIYEILLLMPRPVDLHPVNYRPRLALFLVSHRMHEEAYRVFYSQPIRLFPTHGAYLNSKQALLQQLPVRYREAITCMELRLGPGWSAPPRCQKIHPALGLSDCKNLRTLKIFVEIDPSDDIFTGFRGRGATKETYKKFCLQLLTGIFEDVPSIETVEIDAFPAVRKDAPLLIAVVRHVRQAQKRLGWGPSRDWAKEQDAFATLEIENVMASLSISAEAPRMVEVKA